MLRQRSNLVQRAKRPSVSDPLLVQLHLPSKFCGPVSVTGTFAKYLGVKIAITAKAKMLEGKHKMRRGRRVFGSYKKAKCLHGVEESLSLKMTKSGKPCVKFDWVFELA
jgi:hypothetical protein